MKKKKTRQKDNVSFIVHSYCDKYNFCFRTDHPVDGALNTLTPSSAEG